MSEFDEAPIYVIEFSGSEERRAERDRQRIRGRGLYRDGLIKVLADLGLPAPDNAAAAERIIDHLFVIRGAAGAEACGCSCHPRLPETEFHGYGFDCPCRLSDEERRASWDRWVVEMEAHRQSPEGVAHAAAMRAEEDELVGWLVGHPDVVVTSHGGWAPEQWRGSVSGHSFYFRERHDDWRIECDLQPSGRFVRAWRGGDFDDDSSFELTELTEGRVIAEGTVNAPGYGRTATERIAFIVGIIGDHLRRQQCQVHTVELAELEWRFERPVRWCPACGFELQP